MTCKITIQTVDKSLVADVSIQDHEGVRHSAWRGETTLEDVLATLPKIVSQLKAKPPQFAPV